MNIKEDIFEAIRVYEKTNPILNLKDNPNGTIRRHNNVFMLMGLGNGKLCAIPHSFNLMFYRGESKYRDSCFPSIYRENPKPEEILLNRLKILDFRDICKTFPSVINLEEEGLDVRYDAIAQHYGLKTDIVDLTTDIGVAAFFATHKYEQKSDTYYPKTEEYGVLRAHTSLFMDKNFEIIGLQPFKRTAQQAAFGIRLKQGEDFCKISSHVIFRQNKDINERIGKLFCHNTKNELFQQELIIEAAKSVFDAKSITEKTVMDYCATSRIDISTVLKIINDQGYEIVQKPVFILDMIQRRELERFAQQNPYGGIKLKPIPAYTPTK